MYVYILYCFESTSTLNIPENINQRVDFSQSKELYDEQMKFQIVRLNDTLSVFINKLYESLNLLGPLQTHITEKILIQWKREQQLVGNGYKYKMDLGVIQTWWVSIFNLLTY